MTALQHAPSNALATAATLGDVLRSHAEQRPDKPAFTTAAGMSISFSQFNTRVNQLCNALAANGIQKGDRVAILSRNRIEYVETFGLSKSGVIVVPLNWRLAAPELLALLLHSAPEIVIVEEQYQPLIQSLRTQLPDVRMFVSLSEPQATAADWVSYETLIQSAPPHEPTQHALPDDVLCLVYTSGTTGAPKGVKLTHGGAMENCRTAAGEMLGLTEQDYSLAVLPLFHVGGMWYHLFPSFASGCTTLLLSEFEPGALLQQLQSRQVTNVHLVPTMINAVLNHPLSATIKLDHLRLIFYAASSMPADLLRRAMHCFAGCSFAQGYGSTESGVVTVLSPDDHLRAQHPQQTYLLSSCGRAFNYRQLRIINDHGETLANKEIGEIQVRSPAIMAGYWHDDPATQRVLDDGWLKMGDLGYLDDEGYLYIVDRKNDMVITGGENVYPTEVESFFYRDPDVLEAAVFGIPDAQWVERVVAAVVLRPGATVSEEELIRRIRQNLAAYKCPKNIFFTTELPKSAAGKVLRKDLRNHYQTVE